MKSSDARDVKVLGTRQDDAGSLCCVDGRAQIGHSSTALGIYLSVLDDLTYCSAPGLIPKVQCQQSGIGLEREVGWRLHCGNPKHFTSLVDATSGITKRGV